MFFLFVSKKWASLQFIWCHFPFYIHTIHSYIQILLFMFLVCFQHAYSCGYLKFFVFPFPTVLRTLHMKNRKKLRNKHEHEKWKKRKKWKQKKNAKDAKDIFIHMKIFNFFSCRLKYLNMRWQGLKSKTQNGIFVVKLTLRQLKNVFKGIEMNAFNYLVFVPLIFTEIKIIFPRINSNE